MVSQQAPSLNVKRLSRVFSQLSKIVDKLSAPTYYSFIMANEPLWQTNGSHPHIVAVFVHGQEAYQPYMVTELGMGPWGL